MRNNLVQIKTGEGKSVTLAVVSMIFALNGFEVKCACYSKYLS
jgi:preprotein translocase subunit SecA